MKQFQYTCIYLVGEDGYRAESKDKAIGEKSMKSHVYCSNEDVLMTLLERWTRQGGGIYEYYIDIDDVIYNADSKPINFRYVECPVYQSVMGWHGHDQHSCGHIIVEEAA